ncbi:hypothetical protein [Synechococcus sp. MIT S1220]|uniref:hypothetical protein n=1 Tax=Synechococcus sp. MIT S1220 TaxID=3082549 RepID=UPI0039AEE7F5
MHPLLNGATLPGGSELLTGYRAGVMIEFKLRIQIWPFKFQTLTRNDPNPSSCL